ncbi:serine hydroxymethyltransferase [Candidatus Woesearchaeota archaeon]|nr:serine hydroxymethyltransferase [Candidatus Woesearchaeota archaeon]
MTEIIVIVAVAKDGTIGKNNDIPWRISEDFQHFKDQTTGHPCIMGDKTYESLPDSAKPLPGRENIVLTFDKNYKPEGTTIFHDFNQAIEYCKKNNEEKIFITGGATIYKLGMRIADTFELTRIQKDYNGDVFFPEIRWSEWKLFKQEDHEGIDKNSSEEVKFSFMTYKRAKKSALEKEDIVVHKIIQDELKRQKNELNMIPSENYSSKAVLEAAGSVLMNKYAEGYPKKRYYQGNKFVDDAELVAIERAKRLFNAEHANVQPNSGSPANMAVYFALLNLNDKILGMNLSHGGHLTHGSPVNFSGKYYDFIAYGVDEETGMLDMDKIRKLAEKENPRIIISGFTAYPRKIDFKEFHDIAESVGAYSMADISHIAGLIVGGAHPSPLPFTDIVTTTTHKTLRGPRSAIILCKKQDRLAKTEGLDEKAAKKAKNLAGKIDRAVFPGLQGGPHEHTIAAKAVSFQEAMKPEFKDYAKQIVKNAKALADKLMSEGINLVSGGTDTHLILIDLIKTKRVGQPGMGREAAVALEEAGIITNCNTIPFDPSTPFKPSGVRLGTPVLTTRGMKEPEMELIGKYMADILNNLKDTDLQKQTKQKVLELCNQFVYY